MRTYNLQNRAFGPRGWRTSCLRSYGGAIPLRTFASFNDEMSERGRGALERFSVVPSILLPPYTAFSPSPLPFRLVLVRSQHILSGKWKPTQPPNGFEEVLPIALAFSPRLCGIGTLLTHTCGILSSAHSDAPSSTRAQGPHSLRMILHPHFGFIFLLSHSSDGQPSADFSDAPSLRFLVSGEHSNGPGATQRSRLAHKCRGIRICLRMLRGTEPRSKC